MWPVKDWVGWDRAGSVGNGMVWFGVLLELTVRECHGWAWVGKARSEIHVTILIILA